LPAHSTISLSQNSGCILTIALGMSATKFEPNEL
jgi:hypothetical protein